MQRGVLTQTLNTLCDEIIFQNNDIRKATDILLPVLAGTTNKDPDYLVKRSKNDKYYKYLFVLEYVISGKGHIEYEGKKYTVRAGDFYILNRYTNPEYNSDKTDPMQKIWVNICGRFMNALAYTYRIAEPVFILRFDGEKYIRAIHEELKRYPLLEAEKSYNKIMAILLELFQQIEIARSHESTPRQAVEFNQIADYIVNNITFENLDVDHICTYFYISYSTFYRLVLKNTGMTPKHYIQKLKVEYAQNLFITTGCSVQKAADVLNFSSAIHLRKVFEKFSGCSPTEWKRMQKIPEKGK